MFSSTGTFSGTEQDLADRGLRALFSIQCIAYELIDPKPELLCMLFDRLVSPVLLLLMGIPHCCGGGESTSEIL